MADPRKTIAERSRGLQPPSWQPVVRLRFERGHLSFAGRVPERLWVELRAGDRNALDTLGTAAILAYADPRNTQANVTVQGYGDPARAARDSRARAGVRLNLSCGALHVCETPGWPRVEVTGPDGQARIVEGELALTTAGAVYALHP